MFIPDIWNHTLITRASTEARLSNDPRPGRVEEFRPRCARHRDIILSSKGDARARLGGVGEGRAGGRVSFSGSRRWRGAAAAGRPAGRPVRGVVTGQFVAADGGCRGWGRYEGNVGQ